MNAILNKFNKIRQIIIDKPKEQKTIDQELEELKKCYTYVPGATYYKAGKDYRFSFIMNNREYRDLRADLFKDSLHELDLILEYLGSSDKCPKKLYKQDDDFIYKKNFTPDFEYRKAHGIKYDKIRKIIHGLQKEA